MEMRTVIIFRSHFCKRDARAFLVFPEKTAYTRVFEGTAYN